MIAIIDFDSVCKSLQFEICRLFISTEKKTESQTIEKYKKYKIAFKSILERTFHAAFNKFQIDFQF